MVLEKLAQTRLFSFLAFSPSVLVVFMKFLLSSHSSRDRSAFPQELAKFSAKVAAVRASRNLKSSRDASFHAAPLMPLNPRDSTALARLFEREDIEDIENNVRDVLLAFIPQPCWEDNFWEQSENFDFLAEYL